MADETVTLYNEVDDLLLDVVWQACYVKDTWEGKEREYLDSMALSAYASGMRYLATRGMLEIESEYGRRVIAKVPRADRERGK